jgi:hypothetical protein
MEQPNAEKRNNNKGKSRRETKLSRLQKKFGKLPEPKAWMPINLNKVFLQQLFTVYWDSPKTFNIDKAIAVFTLIIIERYRVEKEKRNYHWHQGYTNVHSKDFRKWIGKDYRDYINVLREGGIIEVNESYAERTFSKSYKIKEEWLQAKSDSRKFKKVDCQDYHLRLKIFEHKVKEWEGKSEVTERQPLIQYAKEVILEYDLDGLIKYMDKKKLRNLARIEERELEKIQYTRHKEMDHFWENVKDDFGSRLHTPFTSMKKEYRRFIKINGETGVEIDIKNSQMYFLACLCKYPDIANEILREGWNDKVPVELCIKYIQNNFIQNKDFHQFTELALNGSIYEFIQDNLDKKKQGRDAAKKKVFITLFSDGSISKFSDKSRGNVTREKMEKLFPTVVKVCTVLNRNDKYLIPKLMQNFESRIMIDKVGVSAAEKGLGKFVTIHDSFICAPSQVEEFKNHIAGVFSQMGLPVPVLRI